MDIHQKARSAGFFVSSPNTACTGQQALLRYIQIPRLEL